MSHWNLKRTAAFAALAALSPAPVAAQQQGSPHGAPAARGANAPAACPMQSGMHGGNMADQQQMQAHMKTMHAQMQAMRTEMKALHAEMTKLRQEMQQRH